MAKQDRFLKGKKKELAEIDFGLQEAVEEGMAEVNVKNGQKYYNISKMGEKYVEAMPFETERERELWKENFKLKEKLGIAH